MLPISKRLKLLLFYSTFSDSSNAHTFIFYQDQERDVSESRRR